MSTIGVVAGASAPPNDAVWLSVGAEGVNPNELPAVEVGVGDGTAAREVRVGACSDWAATVRVFAAGCALVEGATTVAGLAAGCDAAGSDVSARLVTVPLIEKSLSCAGPTASSLEGAGKAMVGGAGLLSVA